MKKWWIVIRCALLVIVLASGCTQSAPPSTDPTADTSSVEEEREQSDESPAPAEEEPSAGSTEEIVVAQGVDVGSLDPARRTAVSEFNVLMHIFDPILTLDENYELAPMLASSWSYIDDTTLELKLQEGVEFHNGEPFTAEAVKLAFDRILENPESPQHTFLAGFLSPEIVDDHTVLIKTEEPMASSISILAWMLPVPPRYLEEVGDEAFGEHPIGTGPFQFSSWERDQRLALEVNSDYWRGSSDIQSIVFRPIPEPGTRIAELRTDAVDLVTNVAPNLWRELQAVDGISTSSVASARYIFIGMNLMADTPLQDQKVRQALNYAVDKDAIIANLLDGHGFPLAGPVTEVHFGHNPDVEPYPYDPEKAGELLAEAGYADGFSIRLLAPQGRYLQDSLVAEAVAGQLQQVGIDVDLQILEYGTYSDQLAAGDVELYLLGWGIAPAGDPHYIYNSLFHSENGRYAFFDFPEIDALIEEGATTLDRDEREAVYQELMALVNEEAPWLFLYQQEDLYATTATLQDWSPDAHERIYLYGTGVSQGD